MKVIVFSALFNVYVPSLVTTLSTSAPASFTNVKVVESNSTRSLLGPSWVPLLKLTVLSLSSPVSSSSSLIGDVCGFPFGPIVVEAIAVGSTGIIVGV